MMECLALYNDSQSTMFEKGISSSLNIDKGVFPSPFSVSTPVPADSMSPCSLPGPASHCLGQGGVFRGHPLRKQSGRICHGVGEIDLWRQLTKHTRNLYATIGTGKKREGRMQQRRATNPTWILKFN